MHLRHAVTDILPAVVRHLLDRCRGGQLGRQVGRHLGCADGQPPVSVNNDKVTQKYWLIVTCTPRC